MNASVDSAKKANVTFLGNIAISWRIGFLIVLGLVGFAATEVISVIGEKNLNHRIEREEAFADMERRVLKADIGALLLRRREKDFLLRKDLKYWDKYEADFAQTIAELNVIKDLPESAPVIGELDAMVGKLEEHKIQFRKVVDMQVELGLSEKVGLKGKLRKAVHGVESKLKEAGLDALTVKMLMMRRHEKDFMLRGAEKYLGRVVKRRTEFDPLLAATSISDGDKAEISTLMDTYQKEMKAYGALAVAMVPEVKRLSAIYKEMGAPSAALSSFARESVEKTKSEVRVTEANTSRMSLITKALAAAVLLLLGILVMRSLTGPIRKVAEATTDIAKGDNSVEVPATGNRDEVGSVARALLVFKENMAETERLRDEYVESERKAKQERDVMRSKMADSFEAKVGNIVREVSDASSDLHTSSQTMAATAGDTASQSDIVGQAASEASANVQTVASAAEELSASVSEIQRQVSESSEIATSAVAEAQTTNEKIQGLAAAADKIGEVVALITDIAEQTNLLALNATIEAARAGDAGKGFAVVASEVKNLATQTATATDEISTQIASIQIATKESVDAIQKIGGTISRIDEIASTISAAVDEQGNATGEIARSVEQAATGTDRVSSIIGTVTDGANETSATANQINSAAVGLSEQSQTLSAEVAEFLSQVRGSVK